VRNQIRFTIARRGLPPQERQKQAAPYGMFHPGGEAFHNCRYHDCLRWEVSYQLRIAQGRRGPQLRSTAIVIVGSIRPAMRQTAGGHHPDAPANFRTAFAAFNFD
jgi:hypothetical protein